MIEIYPNLFIGSDNDVQQARDQHMCIVHAAKEPWHRQAVGYSGRGAPKDHSEYLYARRGNELFLNLVDSEDPQYIPLDVMYAGARFIAEHIARGRKVLVHCNHGQSRGPGLVFLYLWQMNVLPKPFHAALDSFKTEYPNFQPASGVLGFLHSNCQ